MKYTFFTCALTATFVHTAACTTDGVGGFGGFEGSATQTSGPQTGPTTGPQTATNTATAQSVQTGQTAQTAQTSQSVSVQASSSTGMVNCNELVKRVEQLEKQIKACNTLSFANQCTKAVEGICCPISYNPDHAEAFEKYKQALKVYHDHPECAVGCPDILCQDPNEGSCVGNSVDGAGLCKP